MSGRPGTAVLAGAASLVLAAPAGAAPTAGELASSVTPLTAPVEDLRAAPTIHALAPRVTADRTAVPAAVLFGFDRAEVRRAGRRALVRLAASVARRPGTLRVVGHTDGRGAAPYNQRLSLRRARAVADLLRAGLPASVRVVPSGRGAANPVADETAPDGRDDPDARARNRRVELRFTR